MGVTIIVSGGQDGLAVLKLVEPAGSFWQDDASSPRAQTAGKKKLTLRRFMMLLRG
jgi:hypothetical protein